MQRLYDTNNYLINCKHTRDSFGTYNPVYLSLPEV